MTSNNNIRWKPIIAEGAAIVVSILLAFAIEAWWSDRQENHDEQVLLSTLQVVLANQRDSFSKAKGQAVAQRESLRELLQASLSNSGALNDRELDKLIGDLTWYISNPMTPGLNSILASDNLSILSNRKLQYSLVEIGGRLALFELAIRKDQEFYEQQLMPYLQSHVFLPQINNQFTNQPGSTGPHTVYPAANVEVEISRSHQMILDDIQFQNLLMRRDWRLTDLIEWRDVAAIEDIDSNINDILAVVEREIAK